jgi:hypothetical protein
VNVQRIADKTVPMLLSLVFLLCGCGGAGGGSGSNQSAMLRVVNGMWGSGGVNVIVDGATVATGIPYSSCVDGICTSLSGYVTVKSGGVNFVVQEPPAQSNLVPSQFQKLNLEPNTKNTFVLSPMDTAGTNVGGFLFNDDDIPAASMVKLRVADISPNITAPAWIVPTGTSPSGNPTISSVAVGSASSYITLPPNTYDIYLGGLSGTCGSPVFFNPNCAKVTATLNANQNVTVYLLFEGSASRPVILADN